MSKKVLNSKTIINELRGQSVYFRKEPQETSPPPEKPEPETPKQEDTKPKELPPEPGSEKDSTQVTAVTPQDLQSETKDATLDNEQADKQASTLADNQDDIVETIRKTVKQVGAKTLFIRLTPEEKHEITSIVFAFNEMYRGEGRKTSENEIGRIALNFLMEDYRARGKESILAKVIAALVA